MTLYKTLHLLKLKRIIDEFEGTFGTVRVISGTEKSKNDIHEPGI